VGPRGQRTRKKILEAARETFAVEGFFDSGIDSIVRRAGVSRIAFYQYFSGKSEIFQVVATEIVHELLTVTDDLAPPTADAAGRERLRSWVCDVRDVYDRGVGVFRAAYSASAPSQFTSGLQASSVAATVSSMRSFFSAEELDPRSADALLTILIDMVVRTFRFERLLQEATPDAYPDERMNDALADVLHRCLFGRVHGVNDTGKPPAVDEPALTPRRPSPRPPTSSAAGSATYAALIEAGRKSIIERGLYATRIDDIVAQAGVSHGNFYHYFKSVTELVEVLLRGSLRQVGEVIDAMPSAGGADLREWLTSFTVNHSRQTAIMRVWGEVALRLPDLDYDATAWMDRLRRRIQGFLEPRGFGDAGAEAVVLFALLDSVGAFKRSPHIIESVADLVEVGFLGRPR
jgi:AcrR family transcriptional regulator